MSQGEVALQFFVIVGTLAILFAVMASRQQAYTDKLRRESRQRIEGWERDFQRRLDEFATANPTARCRNCDCMRDGRCALGIRAPRAFCTQWRANDEHRSALELAAMSDEQLLAEIVGPLPKALKDAEEYLSGAPEIDPFMRTQAGRFTRLVRFEIARQQAAQEQPK